MTPWDRIVGGSVRGAALGAVTLWLFALLYFALFDHDAIKDGQFALHLYLFPVPFGTLLGVLAGITKVLLDLHARETAGWVCLGGGGLVAVLAVLCSFLWPGIKSPLALAHPAYGSPLVWAVVEMIYGVALLWRR